MSKIIKLNKNQIDVKELIEGIALDGNYKQGLWVAIRPDGDISLACSSMTYAQLCFLKCSIDVFVEHTLRSQNDVH